MPASKGGIGQPAAAGPAVEKAQKRSSTPKQPKEATTQAAPSPPAPKELKSPDVPEEPEQSQRQPQPVSGATKLQPEKIQAAKTEKTPETSHFDNFFSPRKEKRSLVARPVEFVLGSVMPKAVSGRVMPFYTSYAEPGVAKVDQAIFAVADKGSRVIGGAKERLFKVKTVDDVQGMSRPGFVCRILNAAERALDSTLPPPRKEESVAKEACNESETSSNPELSNFRRTMNLIDTLRTRIYVHTEVRFIMAKVRAKVFIDLNILPPCRNLMARTNMVKARIKDTAVNTKNRCLTYKDKTEDYVGTKYGACQKIVTTRSQILAAKIGAIQQGLLLHAQKVKASVTSFLLPYAQGLKKRMQPLTDKLNAWLQSVKNAERKCVAYLAQKRQMLADTVQAKTAPARNYAKAKATQVIETGHRYTGAVLGFATAKMDSLLGSQRGNKVRDSLKKYRGMLAFAGRVPQA